MRRYILKNIVLFLSLGGDRASLIDDAFQLANVGKVSQTLALEMTEYLHKEKSYVPYAAATKSLGAIGGMLKGITTGKFSFFLHL